MLEPSFEVIDEIKTLSERCLEIGTNSVARKVLDADSSWSILNQKLTNSQSDYFNVGLYKGDSTPAVYLIEQRQTALVFLLIASIRGRQAILLNFRFEPGLINGVNLTATIQSTPNNFLRSHGGKPTPFIEFATQPARFGRVIHDSQQYDWGEHYLSKKKQFLIVEVNAIPETPDGFCWVALEHVPDLLLSDQLITSDLRTILVLMLSRGTEPTSRVFNHAVEPSSQETPKLCSIPFDLGTVDSRQTKLAFFESKSSTREVSLWIQPLLIPAAPMKIQLHFIQTPYGRRFAVVRSTQVGLLGSQIWFPASLEGGKVFRRVSTCAEGGRFWNHEIIIELLLSDDSKISNTKSITWMPREDLICVALNSLESSLELRMALSLDLVDAVW